MNKNSLKFGKNAKLFYFDQIHNILWFNKKFFSKYSVKALTRGTIYGILKAFTQNKRKRRKIYVSS